MTFQFKVQLADITKPPVWRRLWVPTNFTFEEFHLVIQAAFNWYNYHLYQFSWKGFHSTPAIGIPDMEWPEEKLVDSRGTRLDRVFDTEGQRYTYIYDFGDEWLHKIQLEKILKLKTTVPELLAGRGARPPEDCGGITGYQDMLKVLSDPQHEEYQSYRQWLGLEAGSQWDPHRFDLKESQLAVIFYRDLRG